MFRSNLLDRVYTISEAIDEMIARGMAKPPRQASLRQRCKRGKVVDAVKKADRWMLTERSIAIYMAEERRVGRPRTRSLRRRAA